MLLSQVAGLLWIRHEVVQLEFRSLRGALLAFTIEDYLELVDLTGRGIRQNKRGFIDNATPCVLERLNISPEN